MKRKCGKVSTSSKKPKLNNEETPNTDFLSGIRCFIHPANFGAGRLRIFQRLVSNNGGELLEVLPTFCEELTHVVVEEAIGADKVKKLIDPSNYANARLVKCSWLSACSKSKTILDTKDYEIELETKKKAPSSSKDKKVENPLIAQKATCSHNLPEKDSNEAPQNKEPSVESSIPGQLSSLMQLDIESSPVISKNCDITVTSQNTILECQLAEEVKEWKDNTSLQDHSLKRMQSGMKPKFFPKELKERFACARPSSSNVKSVNSHITAELEKLAAAYKSKKDTWRAHGYQKAISAIRNHPRTITSREEALSIRGIGGRLADKIVEIVESGTLRKVAELCEDEETKVLQLFMGVWGAGPTTAQNWYTQGYRTLEDLQQKANLSRHQQIGLKYYSDINSRIPRAEVVEIEEYVHSTALSIKEGLIVMVCGSYRRGKATCGDVDVLITHPDGQSHENIFHPLLNKLREKGFLTDDLVTQEDFGNQKKYLGVCKLPGEGQKYRRLDVIVVPYTEFAPALMYFTGSAQFNRSMRLLAIKMGMSLSEHGLRTGIIRQKGEKLTQGCLLETLTEESIFKHLGLEYRPPQERDH